MEVLTPRQINEMLSHLGQPPRKGLAQHFLISAGSLNRIIDAGDLAAKDVVLEIGPGLGVLTAELVKRVGKVIAIEIDEALSTLLKERFGGSENLTVINENILKITPEQALIQGGASRPYKVMANLPYYIAPTVVRRFLESSVPPTLMVVMVQKEVAQNMVAPPGERTVLSIATQLYGTPKIVGYVKPGAFYPPPKIDSAIVKIDVFPKPALALDSIDGFFKVVNAGFGNARKQLRNSLANGLGAAPEQTEAALKGAGIDPTRRAETLTLEEWGRLYGKSRSLHRTN